MFKFIAWALAGVVTFIGLILAGPVVMAMLMLTSEEDFQDVFCAVSDGSNYPPKPEVLNETKLTGRTAAAGQHGHHRIQSHPDTAYLERDR